MAPNISATLQSKFLAVNDIIESSLLIPDPVLSATLAANAAAGLDEIDVAPTEGKFLYLLAKLSSSTRILEFGTLGGYSATWFAKAVGEEGKVITLEVDPKTAEVARSNLKNAGFENVVEVKVGKALETLEGLKDEWKRGGEKEFDFIFVDADKVNNVAYLKYALQMIRKGGVIVFDNVVRQGRILDGKGSDGSTNGVLETFEFLKVLEREGKVESTAVQTVGPKGWDGVAIVRIL